MRNILPTFSLVFIFLLCFAPVSALAKNVTLAWDANSEPDVIGYQVYYQADTASGPFASSGAYEGSSPIDVYSLNSFTLTGLDDNRVYYFAVTAYDAIGNESPYSNIVASNIVNDNSTGADPSLKPILYVPENGVTAEPMPIRFEWSPLPDGSQGTFTLYYGTDSDLIVSTLADNERISTAAPALLAGIFFFGGVSLSNQRRRALFFLCLTGLVMLLSSCGGGGGGSSESSVPADIGDNSSTPLPNISSVRTVENIKDSVFIAGDLEPGKTYYWKVVFKDGGFQQESETFSFTTRSF